MILSVILYFALIPATQSIFSGLDDIADGWRYMSRRRRIRAVRQIGFGLLLLAVIFYIAAVISGVSTGAISGRG